MTSKSAAYFEVGDTILYGKYLNKKGKIVSFSKNEKGDPTVEVEPIPKGRKENKILKVFRIRKGPKTASRVAARYLTAAKTMEEVLEQIRRGIWGTVEKSPLKLKEVLDFLGGWTMEPVVGVMKLDDNRKSLIIADTEEDLAQQLVILKKYEVSSEPSHPLDGQVYVWDLEKPNASSGGGFHFKCMAGMGVWGYKIIAPNGNRMDVLPDSYSYIKGSSFHRAGMLETLPKYGKRTNKHIRLWDTTRWLKEKTDILQQVLSVLGAEPHVPAEFQIRTRENTGSCAVCFRNIKLKTQSGQKDPNMVLHGYRRPGWGFIHGSCLGMGYPPYELSSAGTEALKKALEVALEENKDFLDRLKTNKVVSIRHRSGIVVQPGDTGWDDLLKNTISGTENIIKRLDSDLKFAIEMIDHWKLRPLPEPGKIVFRWKKATDAVVSRVVSRYARCK